MKKKLLLLLSVMIFITAVGTIIITLSKTKGDAQVIQSENRVKIVTTFYPVYMIGLNLADQMEGMEVKSLTELNTGCLHDYQLTTEDMKMISEADVMIINGGGMESFLEDIRINYPELVIIDASEGVSLLENEEEHVLEDDAEEEEDDHGEFNPHVWLSPKLYVQQIENVRDGLIQYMENENLADLSTSITENANVYIGKVLEIDSKIENMMKAAENSSGQANTKQIVVFHDSFAYLADRAGIEVAFTVPLDSDTSLSAGEIATIIDEVKEEDIKYLFIEQQYSDSIAKQIASETGAVIKIIDSVVTGDGSKDSYLNAMEDNLLVLEDALK